MDMTNFVWRSVHTKQFQFTAIPALVVDKDWRLTGTLTSIFCLKVETYNASAGVQL
jgi:hypothetical protein